jgi:hypothetical protein
VTSLCIKTVEGIDETEYRQACVAQA